MKIFDCLHLPVTVCFLSAAKAHFASRMPIAELDHRPKRIPEQPARYAICCAKLGCRSDNRIGSASNYTSYPQPLPAISHAPKVAPKLLRRGTDSPGGFVSHWTRPRDICTSPTDATRLFGPLISRRERRCRGSVGQATWRASSTFLHTITMNAKGDLFTGETIGGRRVQKFRAVAN